jgi:hypothetical protein
MISNKKVRVGIGVVVTGLTVIACSGNQIQPTRLPSIPATATHVVASPAPAATLAPNIAHQYVVRVLYSTAQMDQDMTKMVAYCHVTPTRFPGCHDALITVLADSQKLAAVFSIRDSVPEPFLKATDHYVEGLQFFSQGASIEVQGVDSYNEDKVQQGYALIQQGSRYLHNAGLEMEQVAIRGRNDR